MRSKVDVKLVTEDDDRLDAEAMADHAAGRVVAHADVAAWLESWGSPNELPCPDPKAR